MRGESRRALVFADECTKLTCFSSVSSSQPALPPTTCTKTGTRGASPSSSPCSCEKNRTRWDAREEPKAPVRTQGRLPALCAHRPVRATLAVGQDNRPISPGAPPHQLPPIISS